MKNILLPTDFSENSINAINYALELFKDQDCNFFILHTQRTSTYISDDLIMAGHQSLYDTLVKTSKQKLADLLSDLKKEFNCTNFRFELIVDYDELPEAINQIIVSKKIDLIVMGTNGVTGAKEVVFGSNTINVIRHVDCPTLTIPEGFVYRVPSEILLPLDNLDSLEGSAFLNALKFIKHFGEKLHLLRITNDAENSKESKEDLNNIGTILNHVQHEYHTVSGIPISTTVDCYIQTHQIDLITMLVRDENLFERIFNNSETTKINSMLKAPLLVFHS